jgi:hypothetical protein
VAAIQFGLPDFATESGCSFFQANVGHGAAEISLFAEEAAPTKMLHPQRRLSEYGTPPPSEGYTETGG